MDNPHPLWTCLGCARQWHWPSPPIQCGFCSATYIVLAGLAPDVEARRVTAEFQGIRIGHAKPVVVLTPIGSTRIRTRSYVCGDCGELGHNRRRHRKEMAANVHLFHKVRTA